MSYLFYVMTKKIKVLIAEDEPLTTDSYKKAMDHIISDDGRFSFDIKTASNCDSALLEIDRAIMGTLFNLVFLDLRIAASSGGDILSGADLGVRIKELFPMVKIIVFTSDDDRYTLNKILRIINPDAFLVKREIDFNILVKALKIVIHDPPYYSRTIIKLLRHQISNNFVLDETLKEVFGVEHKDDRVLIELAKERGFI